MKCQKYFLGENVPGPPRSSRLRRSLHAFGVSAGFQAVLVRPTTIQKPRHVPARASLKRCNISGKGVTETGAERFVVGIHVNFSKEKMTIIRHHFLLSIVFFFNEK